MPLKSFKIPLWYLTAGIIWAVINDHLITVLTKGLNPNLQDIVRSLNDSTFVCVVAVVLYFAIKKQHDKLIVSEEQYRNLFESLPNPMWIYNMGDLRFVKVNDAAIKLYGYSNSEFLDMTIMDIRPADEHGRLFDRIKTLKGKGQSNNGNWKHLKKNGEPLFISIESIDVCFNKTQCRLVMATNNTEVVLKEQKIVTQSNTLNEIAWSNSHEVRRPLCSIISLVDLLKNANDEADRQECIQLLEKCSTELDEVLRQNNKKVETL